MALQGQPALVALRGLVALLELQARQGLPAQLAQLETLGRLVRLVQQERRVPLGLRVRLALLVLRGP